MRPILIFFSACLLCSTDILSQKITINGEPGSPKLTWDDFKGKPDKSSPYFAYTYWDIFYSWAEVKFSGDTVKWDVKITLDLAKDRTWKKKDNISDTLLKHEQGHFDIGRMCAKEAQEKVRATVFLKNTDYKEKLRQVVTGVVMKYKYMNEQYDEETKHSANRVQQWKWDDLLTKEIDNYR